MKKLTERELMILRKFLALPKSRQEAIRNLMIAVLSGKKPLVLK